MSITKSEIGAIMQPKNEVAKLFPSKLNDIVAFLGKYSANISQIAPTNFNVARFIARAASEIARNEGIRTCEPKSIVDAMLKVSMLGLEPSTGEAYFIPRKFERKLEGGKISQGYECTVMLGYQGLQRLMFENLNVQRFDADVVTSGDFFEFQKGTSQFLRHTKGQDLATAENTQYAWALVKINGNLFFDVVNVGYIKNAQKLSKGDVWKYHFGEMATKTAIRHLLKRLPIYSDKLKQALSLEDAKFGDFQKLEDMVIIEQTEQPQADEVTEICVLLSNGDMGIENIPEKYKEHPEVLKVLELIKQNDKEGLTENVKS